MLAARLYEPRNIRIEDVPVPEIPQKWVLIKPIIVGICGTDKAFYSGRYPLFKKPITLGHEVVGKVVKGPNHLLEKIVVSEINFACGKCFFCRSGMYTHCPYRKTLGIDFDGAMAEYFIAPVSALHIIEDIDPLVAVFAEPLAAILNAFEQYPPKPTMKIAVLGSGNIALLSLQVLKAYGYRDVVAIVRSDSPKKKFIESLGIEIVELEYVKEFIETRMRERLGFDMVIEATGNPEALNVAIEITRPRGVIHLKSTPGVLFSANLTHAVVKELRIVGTRCGSFKEFQKAIELLRNGVINPIVTSVYTGIYSVREAFERAFERDQVKVVIRFP